MRGVLRILPSLSEEEFPEVMALKCFLLNSQLLEQHPDHTSKVLSYFTPWKFFLMQDGITNPRLASNSIFLPEPPKFWEYRFDPR